MRLETRAAAADRAASERDRRPALSLPADERAALVLRLAESLDEQDHDEGAEDAWAAEVAARIETVRAGTAETITTAEALGQARARLSARRA